MYKIIVLLAAVFLFSCASTTYYIVRHAEKQGNTMLSDPPLTTEGEKQAIDLKLFLQEKKIKLVYSTNYARTLATAEPTRQFFNTEIKLYDSKKIPELVAELKKIKGNGVLIVGHSNTVDDVVNGLTSSSDMHDLNDSEYGDVFIVTKNGSSINVEKIKLPKLAPRM